MAQKALDAVAGVDLNPFAVAISRFRLFVAALQASGVQRLANAHDFQVSVAIGDSLLHGTRFGLTQSQELFDVAESHADTGLAHAYASEDLAEVQRILGRQYHAVVGNPPYIVVKDAALNAAYRRQYASCHMKYSLGAPFTERFFELAVTAAEGRSAGYVGLITANSFMKREFGSKLIEQVLPMLDLTHVVDTSGAYIPGHGTPTVILFGRHRSPVAEGVRTVMGIKGEPSTPDDPAQGLVWSAILGQIDRADSESDFVSVADTPRTTFAKHPWSIGGGGAAGLREQIEAVASQRLNAITAAVGVMVVPGEDEVFVRDTPAFFSRAALPSTTLRELVEGDAIRDWQASPVCTAIYEYASSGQHVPAPELDRYFWGFRALMRPAIYFGRTKEQRGMHWREYGVIVKDKLGHTATISFAEIATHNHFVLDRSGKVFKQTAPVIKLPAGSSEDDHLGLLGLLNSSVACFWLQQVCHNKGGPGGGSSKDEKWHDFYAFNSTKVAEFPLVNHRPTSLASRIDELVQQLAASLPAALMAQVQLPSAAAFAAARERTDQLRREMISTQEELDWHCYRLYGLLTEPLESATPPAIRLGERAFEIVMARRMASGALETKWFDWLDIQPVTELPAHWSQDYQALVHRRIAVIEGDRSIGLIESAACKRRWESAPWADLEQAALRDWLLARLEAPAYFPRAQADSADQPPQLTSTSRLADAVSYDAEFMQIASLYAQSTGGHTDFDLPQLVAELVAAESVPALPVQRCTDTGLRKRAQWQDTWALQRREDAIDAEVDAQAPANRQALLEVVKEAAAGQEPDADALVWVQNALDKALALLKKERKAAEVGAIPVPPKYQSKDFLKTDCWRLRGGLDVPKERWVSYPGCERGSDGSLLIAWAGWNHLQQATALAGYYLDMKDSEGWEPARLQPLLASLLELVPWLEQWHNEIDPAFGERMGDYYRSFVTEEARALGFTLDDLRGWKPVAVAAKRGRKKAAVPNEND
jgi:hypothetical protein